MDFEVIMRKSAVCLSFLLLGGTCLAQSPVPAAPVPAAGLSAAAAASNEPDQGWLSAYGHCRNAIRMQEVHTEVDSCRMAVDLAEKAGDKNPKDQVAMLQSYESYGQALLLLGRGPEALAAENKAVDLARTHLTDSDQEYAMPFYWRALVESHFHDGANASTDLGIVEDSYRKAMEKSPRMRMIYRQYLARILRQHAALLDAMGKTTDGDKLRAEATAL